MGKINTYLNQLIVGNVFDSPEILETYSTDRSPLKIKPKFVAFPESTEDLRKLMRFFNQIANKGIKTSLTPRGSGASETGADLSNGVIISTEKLNRMLEIDPRERLVRVQSGITLKELNTALSVSGLTIPISGHDNETIGGLISNFTIDNFASKYGGIYNFVERIEVILANGECLQTSRLKKYAVAKKASEKTLEGGIYSKLVKLKKTNSDSISALSENQHDLSGYPSIAKIAYKETLDLSPLFFGAQGTLGIISEVILRAEPIKKKPLRLAVTFRNLDTAEQFISSLESLRPRNIDLYDLKIIENAKKSGKNLDGVIKKLETGFLFFITFDEHQNSCARKLKNLKKHLPKSSKFIIDAPDTSSTLDEIENSLISYLNNCSKNEERVPILTNFYLPSINLENFLNDLTILAEKLKLDLALFGSFSNNIYHLRPKFNLEDPDYNKKLTTFLRAGAYIIERQGGTLSGGEAEGRQKAIITNPAKKDAEKSLYLEIKQIFDKNNILNPDIKLGANSRFTLTHLRSSTSSPKITP